MRGVHSFVPILSFTAATWAAVTPASAIDTPDPCTIISSKTFAPPDEVLACLRSFPFNDTIRKNVLANANGVLDFFTFEPYYLKSPPPFQDSTFDIRKELRRMAKQNYSSDYDFNIDLYNATVRLNDGHTMWYPGCYLRWQYLLPMPIVSLKKDGKENVYVIPELLDVLPSLSTSLVDYLAEIGFDWQHLAGAKVLEINGMPPYSWVDVVAREISGNYLHHAIRVNSVFWSYKMFTKTFGQRIGDLASTKIPTQRGLNVKFIAANGTKPETVFVPYVASYIGADFWDSASYWESNCVATEDTNGHDNSFINSKARIPKKQPMGMILEMPKQPEASLPDLLNPTVPPVSVGSKMQLAFYVLPNSTTGVMSVGDFSPANSWDFEAQAVDGVTKLLAAGATSLIIDVHNNGGGFICLGQFLYALLAGTKLAQYPGFLTSNRASPLAQKIVKSYIEQGITWQWYSPPSWNLLNDTFMPPDYNYMDPPETQIVNGVRLQSSQRFHDTCAQTDFNEGVTLPEDPPFAFDKIAIVSNGNCGSTCAMFTTLLHERHQVKTVVFGGKPGEQAEFKGMAGNQVLEWVDIDTEIKTAKLKDDPAAPPDLIIAGNFRVNWRTAWSYLDETKPIAYKSEPAIRFPYTEDTYSNPQNLWTFVAKKVLKVL